MIEAAGHIQEAGLEARVAPGCGSSRVLRWLRRFGILLAIHPQPLHDLDHVLLGRPAWACAVSRNAADSSADVFCVSSNQSHCRHVMVSLVSTGLVIAHPHRKENSPTGEFIPSGPNTKGACQLRRPSTELLGPARVFVRKLGFPQMTSISEQTLPARIVAEGLS